MHKLLYLQDRRAYADRQDWSLNINEVEIQCYAVRSKTTNSWCGYVEIGDLEIDADDLQVHGGISGGSNTSIGFDCFHAGDWWPGHDAATEPIGNHDLTGRYWTFPDVKAETEHLARQIFA
jgi:hypothetical protein